MQLLFVCVVALLICSSIQDDDIGQNRSKRGVDLIVTDRDLNMAIKFAQDSVSRMQRLENSLKVSDVDVEDSSPSHGQLIYSLPAPEALVYGRSALVANKASLYLSQHQCRKHHIAKHQCQEELQKWSLDRTALKNKCSAQFRAVKCTKESKYRSFDGSCNHLSNPSWGQAFSPYKRLLPAQYSDAVSEPRRSVSKLSLPSARLISNLLVPDLDTPDGDSTLALAEWARFVANDFFQTPVQKMIHTGSSIECCRSDGKPLTPRYIHPFCLQITIPDGDPDYGSYGAKCMNYVRSITSMSSKCNFGPADQMNQATHYLDGSMIYGNTAGRAITLRTLSEGHLATSEKNSEQFLPLSVAPEIQCQAQGNNGSICYNAGDSRVNLSPPQTVLHTIWVREHNRIADALHNLNPHWEDKKIYHEARRIIIAQIQHITYKTWLPIILGTQIQKKELQIKSKGFANFYDEKEDPSVSNAFATAGFNFINSLLQKELGLYTEDRQKGGNILLQDHYNNPAIIQEPGVLDGLLLGLTTQQTQKMDAAVVDDVTSKLYKGEGPLGQDIMSLDIQRGRDHGLPSYSFYRKLCGLPTSPKFTTFLDTIPKNSVNKLMTAYGHPDDVDLVIGAILETPVNGAKVGPTLQCLLGEQFARTRRSDRFFYDLSGFQHSFTEGQINELKKASLARILCDNAVGIKSMQIDVFRMPSTSNAVVDCSDTKISQINLNQWKDAK